MEKKVEISTGEITVRGLTSREVAENKIEAATVSGEIDQKYVGSPTVARKKKVSFIADQYFRILAASIVDGGLTAKDVEELLPNDIDVIEAACNELTNLSKEEALDLQGQLDEDESPKKKKTKSS